MTRDDITNQIIEFRLVKGLTWQQLADAVDRPVVWTTSAMSAINFSIDVERKPHPGGDRVVVTLDGKFLGYEWNSAPE
ncbi:hypothetical protein TUM20983_17460 [Mycobacterium antarcticum]|uniref:cyanase n=1 Tax=Mycolicibacterium sp. TUM20983 TaxID=3023369 RepID=UPI002386E6E9|nr:hypothetical protein [Mycolicibacterium sp. TUM20983]GLP74636.1 hypothetical protein TUM20983_17460 [Mycolicibacterium sp. TUM20983]